MKLKDTPKDANALLKREFVDTITQLQRESNNTIERLQSELISTKSRLQEDLYQTRLTIIQLMPKEFQALLNGYRNCKSREDTFKWQRDVVEQIIQRATVFPPDLGFGSSGNRTFCPLCGDGSTTLPEGLSRHLTGWGNQARCGVMATAIALAKDYWEDKYGKWDETEKGRINDRRDSETRFVTSYKGSPQLIDEGLGWNPVRTQESLASAERRLAEMGFSLHSDGRVKSYTLELDDFLIFADARVEGSISFLTFKKPLPKSNSSLDKGDFDCFKVYDRWTRDLRGKFEHLFAKVTGQG